jgi:hypothetical protein
MAALYWVGVKVNPCGRRLKTDNCAKCAIRSWGRFAQETARSVTDLAGANLHILMRVAAAVGRVGPSDVIGHAFSPALVAGDEFFWRWSRIKFFKHQVSFVSPTHGVLL